MALQIASNLITDILQGIKDDTPHLALYTSNPTSADSGTEVSGGGYARQPISFGTISADAMSNTTQLEFVLPTATATHWGVRDASSGGNLKVFGELKVAGVATPMVASAGDILRVPIGELDVTFL